MRIREAKNLRHRDKPTWAVAQKYISRATHKTKVFKYKPYNHTVIYQNSSKRM